MDVLPEMEVSSAFEVRLHQRMEKEHSRQLRWLKLDVWFDLFHIPALVAAVALLFWQPLQLPAAEAHHWQRPPKTEKIQTSIPLKTEQALVFIQKFINRGVKKDEID